MPVSRKRKADAQQSDGAVQEEAPRAKRATRASNKLKATEANAEPELLQSDVEPELIEAAPKPKVTKSAAKSKLTGTGVKPKAAAKRKTTKTTVQSKPDTAATAPKEAGTAIGKPSPEAQKLYKAALDAIDKRVKELDTRVNKVKPGFIGWPSITTDDYDKAAGKYAPTVNKLAAMNTELAFNLAMHLADVSHTDLDTYAKMCGEWDECTKPFTALDDALLPLIETREKPDETAVAAEMPTVTHRWTEKDADVGVFKTGRPNKQQRNMMKRQGIDWEKKRKQKRRERRAVVGDWVRLALGDLVEERDYLAAYGVEKYFPKSIAKLEGLMAARTD